MKAKLSNLRISPRKVRLVAGLIQGKTVEDVDLLLSYLPKRSGEPILKLVKSAYANATIKDSVSMSDMIVKSIRVDQGVTMHRFMPRAFGRASAIKKRSSHIMVTLAEKPPKKEKEKKAKNHKKEELKGKEEAKAVAKKIEKIEKAEKAENKAEV